MLLVEDDDNDIVLFQRSVHNCGAPLRLVPLTSGRQAIEYLRGDGDYADRERHPLPQLIFLDAHLPQVSGANVLEFIKGHAELAPTPVIILTGAISPVASLKLYRLGANAVCLKPLSPVQMHEFVSAMCKFWVESVLPPSES